MDTVSVVNRYDFLFQCKEWGFLLLEMFGTSLGRGDYGHLTVEHVPMLLGGIAHCITCLTKALRLHISSKGNSTQEQPLMIQQEILRHVSWIYLLIIGPLPLFCRDSSLFCTKCFNGNQGFFSTPKCWSMLLFSKKLH